MLQRPPLRLPPRCCCGLRGGRVVSFSGCNPGYWMLVLSCRLLPQGVLKEQPPITTMRASFWLALLGLVAAVHVAIVQSTCAGNL